MRHPLSRPLVVSTVWAAHFDHPCRLHTDLALSRPDRSSPTNKRNIKPSPLAPAAPPYAIPGEPAGLQPLGNPADTFGGYAPQASPTNSRKRRISGPQLPASLGPVTATPASAAYGEPSAVSGGLPVVPAPAPEMDPPAQPAPKKGRTNTPWTPAEEQKLKQMRDAGNSWSEIAKVGGLYCPETTTLGSERSQKLIKTAHVVVPAENGRQREETLVQGRRPLQNGH